MATFGSGISEILVVIFDFTLRIRDAILGVAAVGALPLGFQVKWGLVRSLMSPPRPLVL